MDLYQLRKDYKNCCHDGNLDNLKKIIKNYKGNDLDPDPEYSEALSWAIRRKHFDIAEYLLSSPDVKQNYSVPLLVVGNLDKYNKDITEFILRSDAVKAKFNVFGHKDDYKSVLKAACQYGFAEDIDYLISASESEKFAEEKLRALTTISSMPNPDLKAFDKMLSQVSIHFENDPKLMQQKLTEWLFSSLEYPIHQTGLPKYLIFDKNIQIEYVDRKFIEEKFPECEKLFVARDLKQDLSLELANNNLTDRKTNKL